MDTYFIIEWVSFWAICFAIFCMFILVFLVLSHNKRSEKKLDEIFNEVRNLNLRVTIVETRMEERKILPAETKKDKPAQVLTQKKRGRPPLKKAP